MGKRYPNPGLVKIHRSYTVEEIARLLSKHKNTIRNWIKGGLSTIDEKRPALIQGQVLFDFLRSQRGKNKRHCMPGELYCVRCRKPRIPSENWAEYLPVTETIGNLKAICPDCDSIMNRRVSLSKIHQICRNLDVTFPEDMRHIVKMIKPSVNCDFRQGVSNYGKIQFG